MNCEFVCDRLPMAGEEREKVADYETPFIVK